MEQRVPRLARGGMTAEVRQRPSFDPGGGRPEHEADLVGAGGTAVRAHVQPNPLPNSSCGFAGHAVEVTGHGKFDGIVLKIALDQTLAAGIHGETVRVFRFDEHQRQWRLIRRSGVAKTRGYAWVRLHRPGLYIPIGLPNNEWVLRAIVSAIAALDWLDPARDWNGAAFLPPYGDSAQHQAAAERLARLRVPLQGLPELQILRDSWTSPGGDSLWPSWTLPDNILTGDVPLPADPFWRQAGPLNISGRIVSLSVHPNNGDIVYAGSANGGVWKTTNGGSSWTNILQWGPSLAISALAIAASDPKTIYAATGEDFLSRADFPGAGVYKTVNGGKGWDLLAAIESDRCTRAVVHRWNPDIVYVAGNQGLHRSIDGGNSWKRVIYGHVSDVVMDPLSPNILFAGLADTGISKTVDGGDTWTQLSGGVLPPFGKAGWVKLALVPGMPKIKVQDAPFVVAKMGHESGELFTSDDGCDTWVKMAYAEPGAGRDASRPYADMLGVHPSDKNIILTGKISQNCTHDGGKNWFGDGGDTHVDHHDVAFSTTDSMVCYEATDGGVYRSDNQGRFGTWKPASAGLVTTQFYSLDVSQSLPFLLGGSTQDTGILAENLKPKPGVWFDTNASQTEGGIFVIDPVNSQIAYAAPWFVNLVRSTDGCKSWSPLTDGLGAIDRAWVEENAVFTDVTTQLNKPFPVIFGDIRFPGARQDNALYISMQDWYGRFRYLASLAGAGGAVAPEYFDGKSWQPLKVTGNVPGATEFTSGSGGVLTWYGPDFPKDWAKNAVNGTTLHWIRFRVTQAYNSSAMLTRAFVPPSTDSLVDYLVVNPGDSNELYCTWNGRAYRSRNMGDTWEPVLNSLYVSRIAFAPSAPNTVYAAEMFSAVHKSVDGGNNWTTPYADVDKPPTGRVTGLVVDPANADVVYLAYGYDGNPMPKHVYKSVDGGAHWENASGDDPNDSLPDAPIQDMTIRDGDQLFVLNDKGIFETTDGGKSWFLTTLFLPPIQLSQLACERGAGGLYVATMGAGVWARAI